MPPDKLIIDTPAHFPNLPWYLAAVGVAATVKMQTVLAWLAITVPIISAIIGGLILLGVNNTHSQIADVKAAVNTVVQKQETVRQELAAELARKNEKDHQQDLCLERIETKFDAFLKLDHPTKKKLPLSGGEFGNNK